METIEEPDLVVDLGNSTVEKKRTKRNRKLHKHYNFIRLLIIVLAVGSIIGLTLYTSDFLIWDSTLTEFRTNAEKEKVALLEELKLLEDTANEKRTLLESENLKLEDKKQELQTSISTLDVDSNKAKVLKLDNEALEKRNTYLTDENNKLQTKLDDSNAKYSSVNSEYSRLQSLNTQLNNNYEQENKEYNTLLSNKSILEADLKTLSTKINNNEKIGRAHV